MNSTPVQQCVRPLHLCIAVAALFGIYIASYAVNSAFGGYSLRLEHDPPRWSPKRSLPTAILWQPAYGYSARYQSDWLGVIYSPLIALDRHWRHPAMSLNDDTTFTWINEKARATDIHPRWRAEFLAEHPGK